MVEERRLAERTFSELLDQCANCPKNKLPQRRLQLTFVYDRDPIVVIVRKKLAGYLCEVAGCRSHRFQTEGGDYFGEVHHLHPLSEGGPDILANTVALCPTHHRFIHVRKDRGFLTDKLREVRQQDVDLH